jgi:hypothetical protein
MTDFFKGDVKREKATLNKAQMEDLRDVHYKLGNYRSDYSTTAHDSYVPPVGASRATLSEEVRKDLRAHHFDVNSGGAPTLKSNYAASFEFHPEALVFNQAEEDMKRDMKANVAGTHYQLGKQGANTYTTTGLLPDPREYEEKQWKPPAAQHDEKTNWSLGTANLNYQTTYCGFNDGKERGKDLLGTIDTWQERLRNSGNQEVNLEDIEQVRRSQDIIKKSSLYMGADSSVYHTSVLAENLAAGSKAVTAESNHQRRNNMKSRILENNKTHYNLGTSPLDYEKTMVMIDPRASGFVPSRLSIEAKEQLKNTHFHVGFEENKYTTTASDDFVTKKMSPSALNAELKADLRASHFKVGSDSEIRMRSNYADTHNLSSDYKNPALFPEVKEKMKQLKSELKDTHYILGMDRTEYQRSMQMPKHEGFKKEKVKDQRELNRRTNWSMGHEHTNYQTEMDYQMSRQFGSGGPRTDE